MKNLKNRILAVVLSTSLMIPAGCATAANNDAGKNANSAAPVSSAAAAAKPAEQYWPQEDWRSSTPEEQGVDSQILSSMYSDIQKNNPGIKSTLIIRNGYVVSEGYFYPNQKDTLNELFSITKSFNSALLGIAMSQGYIKNLDEKVVDIFPDIKIKDMDEKKKSLSIKNLLTMSAGHGQDTFGQIFANKGNWVETYMNIPFQDAPGSKFLYDSGATYALSYIIEKKTGQNLYDFAEKNLFDPIGIKSPIWGINGDGKCGGYAGLQLTSRDMARLGYLYLNNGVWNGKQVVPAEWVKESTTKQIDNSETGTVRGDWEAGYGYNFWLNAFGGFRADGMGSQYVFVLPEYNTVAVFTSAIKEANGKDGYTPANHPYDYMKNYVIPAMKSKEALAANADQDKQLADISADIEKEPAFTQPATPDLAYDISGVTYKMDQNPNGIGSVQLVFDKKDTTKAKFILNQQGADSSFDIGLNGKGFVDKSEWQKNIYTNLKKGHWENDKTFILESLSIGSIWTRIYTFDFSDKKNLKLTLTFPYPDMTSGQEKYTISGKAQ